ncbi:hypothetical protein ACFQ34_09870 [Pseudonocardia benzenivorans]|uniref:Uncharacterized protein n=1 Tax=Pseudonocardia benzenivorans TaxID=228005 RepID=A0ABW3VH88_9PSEU|nr:hypothetical protein [Pseudonocardia dioxanivorans]
MPAQRGEGVTPVITELSTACMPTTVATGNRSTSLTAGSSTASVP